MSKKKRKKRHDGWVVDLAFDLGELIFHILLFPFKLLFKLIAHMFD